MRAASIVYRGATYGDTTYRPCYAPRNRSAGCRERSRKRKPESTKRSRVPGFGGYDSKSNGVTRREKIGRRGDAIAAYAAYKDRKTSILRGEKLPATMKNRGIRLREIGQDAIDCYIRTGKKDLRTFSQRMTAVMNSPLGAKAANDITHEDIDRWINGHDNWSPATRNRYKTTISRAYLPSHEIA
jgi:hypothetical protein